MQKLNYIFGMKTYVKTEVEKLISRIINKTTIEEVKYEADMIAEEEQMVFTKHFSLEEDIFEDLA